jgi:Ni/Fe-hydrogenase subunit HybB-like protein
VKRTIVGSLRQFDLPDQGKWQVRAFLIDLLIATLMMYFMVLSSAVAIRLGIELIPMALRFKWDGTFLLYVIMLIWASLFIGAVIPVRILTETRYWYDRRLADPPKTVAPDP